MIAALLLNRPLVQEGGGYTAPPTIKIIQARFKPAGFFMAAIAVAKPAVIAARFFVPAGSAWAVADYEDIAAEIAALID